MKRWPLFCNHSGLRAQLSQAIHICVNVHFELIEHNMPTNVEVYILYTYAIYFAYRYFCDFGLSGEIHNFPDVFIAINGHILKWKFLKIHENKTRENNHVQYTVLDFPNTPNSHVYDSFLPEICLFWICPHQL